MKMEICAKTKMDMQVKNLNMMKSEILIKEVSLVQKLSMEMTTSCKSAAFSI